MNPNKAFRDRYKTDLMQGFKYLLFMDQHELRLICFGCGGTEDFTVLPNERFYYTTIECGGCGGNNWGWVLLDEKEGRA